MIEEADVGDCKARFVGVMPGCLKGEFAMCIKAFRSVNLLVQYVERNAFWGLVQILYEKQHPPNWNQNRQQEPSSNVEDPLIL